MSDDGFAGVAVVMSKFTDYVDLPERTEGTEPIALFGGAVSLPVAARQSVARGLTGFEWAVGVPGTVGGAVRMNAGGHGSDMKASLVEVSPSMLTRLKVVRTASRRACWRGALPMAASVVMGMALAAGFMGGRVGLWIAVKSLA